MDATTWQRAQQIFDDAIQVAASERDLLVREACAGDAALRAEVNRLLGAHDSAGEFLEAPALVATTVPDEHEGTQVGSYKLLERIGEGGFAVVYMAEEQSTQARRVAVKLVKPGMDTEQVLARFEAERNALGMMDHPNIARVFDAGTSELGRPYFAMELVRGVPISDYCDQHDLTLADRLRLFADVCDAVQHAHTKGVIHRDIKPSNVMVTERDEGAAVKVIDFGIAKAMHDRLTDRTVFTRFRQVIGTPAYMSPEQAEFSGLDVDTRSDVYSLGVLLYELLTGQPPFETKAMREAPFDELCRIIREVDPPTPSSRVGDAARSNGRLIGSDGRAETRDRASSILDIARRRRTDPRALTRSLRGDLDWIVMRCLEKDRARRYQSAAALAEDVDRFLKDEPVQARPPSATYQFKKLIARNKIPFAFVAALLVLIVGFGVWMAALYRQTDMERDQAETAIESLVEVFGAVDPAKQGKDVTLREMLDQASATIGDKFEGKPLVEARLRARIGNSYLSLGMLVEAEPHLERALDIRRDLLGEEHLETLQSMNDVVELYHERDRLEEADPLSVRTLAVCEHVLGETHVDTLRAMRGVGHMHHHFHRWEEGQEVFARALEIARRVYGPEHRETLVTMIKMGFMHSEERGFEKAEPLLTEAFSGCQSLLGDEHPDTLSAMHYLAQLYGGQGRYDEALALQERALEIRVRTLGDHHPHTARAMKAVANVYVSQGRYEEALALKLQVLEVQKSTRGEGSFRTLLSMARLGWMYAKMGRDDEAERWLAQVADGARRLPERDGVVGGLMKSYGVFLSERGRFEEAEAVLLEAGEKLIVASVDGRPARLMCMAQLGELYTKMARLDEAEPLLADAVAGLRRLPRTRPAQLGRSLMYYGACLNRLARYEKAEAALLEAHEVLISAPVPPDELTGRTIRALVELYEAWEAAEREQGYAAKAAEWRARARGDDRGIVGALTEDGFVWNRGGATDTRPAAPVWPLQSPLGVVVGHASAHALNPGWPTLSGKGGWQVRRFPAARDA